MVLMANKTALFAVFKASSRVTRSFLSKVSVSISVKRIIILVLRTVAGGILFIAKNDLTKNY